jgi:hypothetical protein
VNVITNASFLSDHPHTTILEQAQAQVDESESVSMETDTRERYECSKCHALFRSKRTLDHHFSRTAKCEKNRLRYENRMELLQYSASGITTTTPTLTPTSAKQSIYNIQTQNNSVHANINSVNNYNHIENTAKIDVNDFMHDIYDHSHLDYHDLSNDFYILNNFLALILQNKVNQNIFFLEDVRQGAIVYSRETLRKMPSDKAGFILLEKLYKTMENLVKNVVPKEEDIPKFSYMTRYYKQLMNKYRCDTTYRAYDPETHGFSNTTHSNQMRCRDEYLADMVKIVNTVNSDIKDTIFHHSNCDTAEYSYIELNPIIEDFASKRVRYRDLRAK